jgi:hypothetical protein
MRDALGVRGVESVGNLSGVSQCGIKRYRSFEWHAIDELHHEIVRADVVQRADVGMAQRGDGSGFLLEPLGEFGFRDLDGDDPVKAGVAPLIYLAHAAGADKLGDLVGTEAGSSV